jgi:ABC-type transporter Mla MlaB component
MFKAEIIKSGKRQTLLLGGDLIIDNIQSLKQVFHNALSRFKTIEIVFDEVNKIDFSFLQLLCSAEKSAHQKKKKLLLKELPGIIQKAAEGSGFSHLPLLLMAPGKGES